MLLREQNVCLNVGEEAPDFELPDENGNMVRLSNFRGKKNVLLALNPGDLNDSCKNYLLLYKGNLEQFKELDTQVLGINMDTTRINKAWAQSLNGLGFPLLSDREPLGNIILNYDCFVPKEGYGKRGLFVIDKKGIIQYIDVLPEHVDSCPDMSEVLASLQQ